jgi:hypothetical protein
VRDASGTVSVFRMSSRTSATTVNDSSVISGQFRDRSTYLFHGYVRAADGTIKKFDPVGSVGTTPASINGSGAITGWYADSNQVAHGFVRTP